MYVSEQADDDAELKFRDMVRLRTMRKKWISSDDEHKLLSDAVERLGVSLTRARMLLMAELDRSDVKLESDVDDVTVGMVMTMADKKGRLKLKDFDMIARYIVKRNNRVLADAESKVKEIMTENNIQPRGSGLFASTRWFRAVK